MEQSVFLHFQINLKKKQLQPNQCRIFQFELMYQSGLAISQKVKVEQKCEPGSSQSGEEHQFLFLQVPFKLLLGTDVFMIIKVFTSTVSKSANEHDYVWT